eukprot:Polyplicarium_translucidae@DN5482_c0_g1_i1.p1
MQESSRSIRAIQYNIIKVAQSVKDAQFREAVKHTTLRLVELLDSQERNFAEFFRAAESLIVEEAEQRRQIEKSLKFLAKTNYRMEASHQRLLSQHKQFLCSIGEAESVLANGDVEPSEAVRALRTIVSGASRASQSRSKPRRRRRVPVTWRSVESARVDSSASESRPKRVEDVKDSTYSLRPAESSVVPPERSSASSSSFGSG